MTSQISTTNKYPGLNTKYWWVEVLLGIGFIGLSFWFYATPIETYISLAVFFSYAMFITGIFEIINAISSIKTSKQWSILLIGGIIDLVLGYLLITNENLTMEVLPILVGIWFVIRSLAFFLTYGKLKSSSIKHTGWFLVAAILTLLFGLAILAKPVLGQLTLVFTISFAFFFMGLFRLTLGIKMFNTHKK